MHDIERKPPKVDLDAEARSFCQQVMEAMAKAKAAKELGTIEADTPARGLARSVIERSAFGGLLFDFVVSVPTHIETHTSSHDQKIDFDVRDFVAAEVREIAWDTTETGKDDKEKNKVVFKRGNLWFVMYGYDAEIVPLNDLRPDKSKDNQLPGSYSRLDNF